MVAGLSAPGIAAPRLDLRKPSLRLTNGTGCGVRCLVEAVGRGIDEVHVPRPPFKNEPQEMTQSAAEY